MLKLEQNLSSTIRVTAAEPGMITGTPRLSVVVPVRNGRMSLGRCLDGLAHSDYAEFEVIVVDDCSADDSATIAARYGARCVRTPQTLGPAGARNLGASETTGDIIVFVDADVVVPPGALSRVANDFEHDAELTAVFGSYDDQPAWKTFISQYKNLMHHYVHQTASESATTFWAGCGAIRRSVFEEIGGFDAATYKAPSIEDIALGVELARQGRAIRLDKQLQVKHLKRWTVRNLLRADILYRAVPWTKLILNAREMPRDLNLNYASRVSSVLVSWLTLSLLLLPFSVASVLPLAPAICLAAAALCAVALLALNFDVYRFFWRKRGLWFVIRVVPVHWAYYLYSGLTFAFCMATHVFSAQPSPARKPSVGRT